MAAPGDTRTRRLKDVAAESYRPSTNSAISAAASSCIAEMVCEWVSRCPRRCVPETFGDFWEWMRMWPSYPVYGASPLSMKRLNPRKRVSARRRSVPTAAPILTMALRAS